MTMSMMIPFLFICWTEGLLATQSSFVIVAPLIHSSCNRKSITFSKWSIQRHHVVVCCHIRLKSSIAASLLLQLALPP
jgi:hypothetical protein